MSRWTTSCKSTLDDAYMQMTNAKLQLQSEQYSRMLIYSTLPVSGDETYAFTDTVTAIAQKYYPGEKRSIWRAIPPTSTNLKKSFAVDNKVVSIVSILIVMAVLLFTFNSAGMPVLLILVIQGCIWINFSFPHHHGQIPLLPGLPDCQLDPDGREHRLRHRHRQPLSGDQGQDAPPRRHH